MTIDVEPGYKVTNATFKDEEIWYFVEKMDSTYVPTQKKLVEKSMYGAFEGTIIFKERRCRRYYLSAEYYYWQQL